MNRSEQQFFLRHITNQEPSLFKSGYVGSDTKKFFYQLSYYKGSVPIEIEKQIESIIKEVDKIIENLFPLWLVGVPLNIYLLSETITSLLLKKENVKTLDLLITSSNTNISQLNKTPIHMYQELFGKNINEFIDFNRVENDYYLLFSLTQYLLKERYKNEITLEKSDSFTINTQDFNLNIRLSLKPIKNYILKEDMNISKAYVIMMETTSDIVRPYNSFTFLENFVALNDYLQDLMNKHVTVNLYNNKIEDLEKVIEKAKSVQKKYDDFKIELAAGDDIEYKNWKEAYLNKKNLDENLKINTKQNTVINKI